MTLTEARKIILESENQEIFSSHEIVLDFNKTGVKRNFKGILSFYEYLLNQESGFESFSSVLPKEMLESQSFFKNQAVNVANFIKSNSSLNPKHFKSTWDQQINSQITRFNNSMIFEFENPISGFLVELFNCRSQYYEGALHYFTRVINVSKISERDYFNGLILAYEFANKGESDIVNRRKKEKASYTKLQNQMGEYISQAEKDFVDYAASLKEKTNETIDEVTAYKTSKSEEYESWFGETTASFSTFKEETKRKIVDLENLYHEKLKLEAPAKYWNKRARSLKIEGRWWLGGLIASILIGVLIFVIALQWLSDGVLAEIFEDTASAIKWSVIFITLVSFLAFMIKTLSKMTFSTFHLSRDAEEREQLTYVFLAMQKEKAIDPTERHLIMQSLFSRADTGLLKDEGSPTMPGNIFDKVIAGSNGK